MREILFRGKRIDNSEWVFGYYVSHRKRNGASGQIISNLDYDTHYIVTNRGDSYEIDYSTVTQFTERTDKNGTKIFEGDIIKTKYGRLCKVVWFHSPCNVCWDLTPVEFEHDYPDGYDLWDRRNLEVVGNIYDNFKINS